MSIILLICFLFRIFPENVVSQYSFKDSLSELNLAANFTNTYDHIFPRNLQITAYISRMGGLLFYSIDKNMNQLIVNLQDTKIPTLKIEYRHLKYILNVNNLCKCKMDSCLYENLVLKFTINNLINIQCNDGITDSREFTNNKLFSDDYPIPSFYGTDITAYLWLINTPRYQNGDKTVYPNAEYLKGCIYNVTYDGKPVELNSSIPPELNSSIPSDKCKPQCEPNLCNGGECIETFSSKPICDCTNALFNGDYCNKNITEPGEHKFDFEFKIIKVSWKFNLDCSFEILNLTNREKEIRIYQSNANKLIVKFYPNRSKSDSNSMIVENKMEIRNISNESDKYILLMELLDENLSIKIKNNANWTESNFYIGENLTNTEFHEIHFLKNICKKTEGDVAFKISKSEIGWLPAKLERSLKSFIPNPVSKAQSPKCSCPVDKSKPPDESCSIIDIVIGILALVFFVNCGVLIWQSRRKKTEDSANKNIPVDS